MLVTEFGIVTLVRLEQPEKAEFPMLVTEFGMVTLVRPEQPEKTPPASPFVPSFIITDVLAGIVPLYSITQLSRYKTPSD